MDVFITRQARINGSAAAYPWDDCSLVRMDQFQYFETLVRPWATAKLAEMSRRVHFINEMPGRHLPIGITILGSPEDYVVTTASINSPKVKTSNRSRKEFEKAKAEGNIVLTPTLKYRMKATGFPEIVSESVVENMGTYANDARIEMDMGTDYVCYRLPSIGALSCNTNWQSIVQNPKWLRNAFTRPVSEKDLTNAMGDIVQRLGNIEKNSALVTQTVAEANSATFDIATEIGEMPETIKMIVNGVIGGIKLLLRFKKDIKQNLSSGSASHDMASLWMMYRYGLMPIVYSVNDGLDLLAMEARKFQSFRGRTDIPAPEFNLPGGYKLVKSPTVQHRCFLKYGYDLDSKIHQGLKINLAATAWELIPLSFVWDWFFQVGDYLTAMFVPGVVNQIGCTYSYRVNGTYMWENPQGSVISVDVDYYKSEVIKPSSFIGINSDVFVSFKRAMDAISLSWLLFKKRK